MLRVAVGIGLIVAFMTAGILNMLDTSFAPFKVSSNNGKLFCIIAIIIGIISTIIAYKLLEPPKKH